MILTFGYSLFSFTFTVIWFFRMEGPFIFFAMDDPCVAEPINVKSVRIQFKNVIMQDEGPKIMAAKNFGTISINSRK